MGKPSGITVVDLTQFLPGQMMTLMMADQGAEVISPPSALAGESWSPRPAPEVGGG